MQVLTLNNTVDEESLNGRLISISKSLSLGGASSLATAFALYHNCK